MNIKELLKKGIIVLKNNNIEDATIIAKTLLSYTIKKDKIYLLINEKENVDISKQKEYETYIKEIICGKPLQYITNNQEFMKLNFFVDKNVLIPQPDTEILVEEVIKICEKYQNIKILDLCTGSGAIAISLYKYLKNKTKQIYASDISEEAIKIAKKNCESNNAKVDFIQSNMFENITENKFDIIVSNPPYIEKETLKTLPKAVKYEPEIALDGGTDGLDFYRIIANEAYKHIKNNGSLCLEIGYNQKNEVIKILEKTKKYYNIKTLKDLALNDRCIVANIV